LRFGCFSCFVFSSLLSTVLDLLATVV
jgi:hypothetical protein